MKVQRLHLQNFKRFRDLELDFRDPETGLVQDLIVLVGQNGSGKSTVLQAIAAMLGSATQRLTSPAELNWPGFDLSLANGAWKRSAQIELVVEFLADELEATSEYFSRTEMGKDRDKAPPGKEPVVCLSYDPEQNLVWAPTPSEYYEFHGRRYARMIIRYSSEGARLFQRVGGVFWYTEHRTAISLTPFEKEGTVIVFDDVNALRRRMSDWFYFHERILRTNYELNGSRRDYYPDIERGYQAVFPERRFQGPVPRTDIEGILDEPWFYLFDGNSEYEISEMSGGERAVFPLIFDFAYRDIHNSVVLIDELELHLHPPLQQHLLKALRSFGSNNQFIITTHSDAVAEIVPDASIRRL